MYGVYHFGCRMQYFHLFQNCGSIVGNRYIAFSGLDLKSEIIKRVAPRIEQFRITILSIPLGPRLVRMASATAEKNILK